jgi:hypothetical protein
MYEYLTASLAHHIYSHCRKTKLPVSTAVSICARNAPIICREKAVWHFALYVAHFKVRTYVFVLYLVDYLTTFFVT